MNILEYENFQEQKTHGDPTFPYITYPCSIPLDFPCVPLHWHDEVEIIYIKKGRGILNVDLNPTLVEAGTITLILPGRLHSIFPYESESMEYENIIFSKNLLFSRQTDLCSSFLEPLFSFELSVPTYLTPQLDDYAQFAACLDAADETCKTFPPAYPLAIKGQLFSFFYQLLSHYGTQMPVQRQMQSLDRMKQIIKYIEENYAQRITITSIAEVLGMSSSAFMRYFKNTMGISFVEYLKEYRLTMASRMLLASSDSILSIAAECGFDNLSYFNRVFKKRFGMTPREFRKPIPHSSI